MSQYYYPDTRDATFLNQKIEIENKVNDLLLFERQVQGKGSFPWKDLEL